MRILDYAAPMTLDQARQLAMSLPDVTEEPHFEFTSFRIGGKIFATAPPGSDFLHVFLDEEERMRALDQDPDFLEALYWGKRALGVRVLLPAARVSVVQHLLKKAWSQKEAKLPKARRKKRV